MGSIGEVKAVVLLHFGFKEWQEYRRKSLRAKCHRAGRYFTGVALLAPEASGKLP